MNQARFAVLAMRRLSLTLPLPVAIISGVRLMRGQFRIPTQAFPVVFWENHKVDHGPLIPTFSRG